MKFQFFGGNPSKKIEKNLYCADGTNGRMDGTSKVSFDFPQIQVNKWDVLIPNLVSKVVYGFFIRSYEQFKF